MAEVIFVDTSVLLNLLNVPGKNADHNDLVSELKRLALAGATLVIPIAAVIEVGNHIAQLSKGHHRRECSKRFAGFLRDSLDRKAPWIVTGVSWDETYLRRLVDGHGTRPSLVNLCSAKVGSGDASILHELDRYRERSDLPSALPVRLWTLDAQLSSYAS